MNIIKGNLLDITEGVIIHQVNNKHVMGSGVAKQIRAKYPEHYNDYMKSPLGMGTLVLTRVTSKFGIIGMVGQDNFGTNKVQTDYQAFKLCLLRIQVLYNKNKSVKYYMPYNIGCGLAGGDWNRISTMIELICPFMNVIKL